VAQVGNRNYGIEKKVLESSTLYTKNAVRETLTYSWGHKVSAAELRYGFNPSSLLKKWGCSYILVDDNEMKVTIFPHGLAKGYHDKRSKGALTVDCWLLLLGIPKSTPLVSKNFVDKFLKDDSEVLAEPYKVRMPEPRVVSYNPPTSEVIKKIKEKVEGIVQPGRIKFPESWEDMSLNQAFDLLDFHAFETAAFFDPFK